MKPLARRSVVLAASLGFFATALPAARPPARPPAMRPADRFLQTKEHIDTLLKFRLNPDPLPPNPPNPFQLPAGTAATESPDDPQASRKGDPPNPPTSAAPLEAGSDGAALAAYAAGLKITGMVRLNGQVHLIINQSPYKEGDLILLNNQTTTVYLQVVRITPSELTLGLNQAVLIIPLKN
jgi:hypothetical protein